MNLMDPLRPCQRLILTFEAAYIECLLWSEVLPDGEPVDDLYDQHDLADEAWREIKQDISDFLEDAMPLILQTNMTWEQAGHDFALTRNGHGAGYWDRGLGVVGNELSEMASAQGSQHIEVGDNGQLYTHG